MRLNAFLIGANKNLPANDLNEFITYATANHQRMNMGHAGVGSVTHLIGLLFNGILGLKPAMVPFNSAAAAMNALVAGHVDYMSAPIAEVVPQVQGGTIKVFAIASPERSPALPEVPTSREAGLPEFQVLSWNGLFAPKGTPSLVLDKLADALDQALDDETTRKRLFELGSDVPAKARRGQDQLAALVRSEIARWASIVRAATQ